MIALEALFVLVVVGLIVVVLMQHFDHSHDRGHKGDAVKSQEEIESHQPRR